MMAVELVVNMRLSGKGGGGADGFVCVVCVSYDHVEMSMVATRETCG